MRFLHAADIHLDSPLRGLARYEGAPVEALRGATRQAFVNLVDRALELKVDFLILAGDLYDGDWPDYNTGLFFISQISRLSIPVIAIQGNHDAQSRLTRGLSLPPNVKMLSVTEPETFLMEDLRVAVHGQGFEEQAVWKDLTEAYPSPRKGYFNIGLLHTSAEGRAGHAPYAPCTVEGLKNLGYDYWALGHVHQREILGTDPYIVFPGNLQGRHARETGAKGATLVEVVDGHIQSVRHEPLDVVRWERLEIDIEGLESAERVMDCAREAMERAARGAGGRDLAVRVVLKGEGAAHSELMGRTEHWVSELRNQAVQMSSYSVWVEKVRIRTRSSIDIQEVIGQHDALASLLEGVESTARDEERLEELGRLLFSDLESKLPHEWREEEKGGIKPTSTTVLKESMAEVVHLLASRLSAAQGERP